MMWAYCRFEHSGDWNWLLEISGARTHEFLCGVNGPKNKNQALPRLQWIPFKRVIGRNENLHVAEELMEARDYQVRRSQPKKASPGTFWKLGVSKSQQKHEKTRTQTSITLMIPTPSENKQMSYIIHKTLFFPANPYFLGLTLEGLKIKCKGRRRDKARSRGRESGHFPHLPCLCIKYGSVTLRWGWTKQTIRDYLLLHNNNLVSYGLCATSLLNRFIIPPLLSWAPSTYQ